MELFPATDDDAWELIKGVIDASDYYVLIVGGRYGSVTADGVSYTQKEYEYASSRGKYVLALLHKAPSDIPRSKTEEDPAIWKKLSAFRSDVEGKHHCVYWTSAEDLKAKVIVGLTTAVKRKPAIGWIRADKVPSGATIEEVLALRNKLAELEQVQAQHGNSPPPGTEDLVQGEDTHVIIFDFRARDRKSQEWEDFEDEIAPTWNSIFAAIAPTMIDEAADDAMKKSIVEFLKQVAYERLSVLNKEELGKTHSIGTSIEFQSQDVATIVVQLRALGLIAESTRKKSVHDKAAYWKLTPHGDNTMVRLRAIRRDARKSVTIAAVPSDSVPKKTDIASPVKAD
jgi:hypothetical protein